MAGGFRKYDMTFILKVLNTLSVNNYNIQATSKKMGVDWATINRWNIKYGNKLRDKITESKIMTAAVDVSPEIEGYRQSLTESIEKVKELIITRMSDVIPNARNLDHLARAYKILCEIPTTGTGGKENPKVHNYLQFIQMQIDGMQGNLEQINDSDYEQTDD